MKWVITGCVLAALAGLCGLLYVEVISSRTEPVPAVNQSATPPEASLRSKPTRNARNQASGESPGARAGDGTTQNGERDTLAPAPESPVQRTNPEDEDISRAKRVVWKFLTSGGSVPCMTKPEVTDKLTFQGRDNSRDIDPYSEKIMLSLKTDDGEFTFLVDSSLWLVTYYNHEMWFSAPAWPGLEHSDDTLRLPAASPEVASELTVRSWPTSEQALAHAREWLGAKYPDFLQRNFNLVQHNIIAMTRSTCHQFLWFEEPRTEMGDLAVYENRILLELNARTLETCAYLCSNIRLVVTEYPPISREHAMDILRETNPFLFEGYVPPADPDSGEKGWAPPGRGWRAGSQMHGPVLGVAPFPGDISKPLIYWCVQGFSQHGGYCEYYIDAETGLETENPCILWDDYIENKSRQK